MLSLFLLTAQLTGQSVSYYQAKREIIESLKNRTVDIYEVTWKKKVGHVSCYDDLQSVELHVDTLVIKTPEKVIRQRLSTTDFENTIRSEGIHKIRTGPLHFGSCGPGQIDPQLIKFEHNWLIIKEKAAAELIKIRKAESYAGLLADFTGKVKELQPSSPVSDVSEEQRKYIVQANSMNEKKDYYSALEKYEQAVMLDAFSYPTAYYNMALIAAQLEDYYYAIFNMKKYLLLVPGTDDSRAAQDKIYEWEAEV